MTKKEILVATRRLRVRQGRKSSTLTVKLGIPKRVTAGGEWVCHYWIRGRGDDSRQEAFGYDGVQALILALEAIRVKLQEVGGSVSWEVGEGNDSGFPRYVPTYFGRAFAEKLEKVIDREVLRFARSAEKRHVKRSA